MWPGRQVVVVTQIDGKSGFVHNHLFVNSPHPITGLMCRGDDMTWERLMPIHDATLAAAGYVQPAQMPATVHEAKQRSKQARERAQAEATSHLTAILATSPASLEEAMSAAPAGAVLEDEPWELRATGGKRPVHGRRLRIKFTDAEGHKHAFDVKSTGITRDQFMAALEANRAAQLAAVQTPKPVSAPAPTEHDGGKSSPSAPAPVEQVAYVSPLRSLKWKPGHEKQERFAQDLAAFDEETHARLLVGERPIEANVPSGLRHTPAGIERLTVLGPHMDPDVWLLLQQRQAKYADKEEAYQEGASLSKDVMAMSPAAIAAHEAQLKQVNDRRDRLAREIAAGCYEDVDTALAEWKTAHPEVVHLSPADREVYIQHGQSALDDALAQAQRDRQSGN